MAPTASDDWRIELIGAHPRLFHPPEGHPERASGYPWCEAGWRERLCVRIEAALREGETIHFSQIKEKFAALRVYWRGDVSSDTAAQINAAIALGEAFERLAEGADEINERAVTSKFRCAACGQQGEHPWNPDPQAHRCPMCGSPDVVFALSAVDLPDDIVEALLKAEPLDGEKDED
jgi:hypothetical protein